MLSFDPAPRRISIAVISYGRMLLQDLEHSCNPPEVDLLTAENRPLGQKIFVGVAMPSPRPLRSLGLPAVHAQ
ncbi:hypothetical protein DICSQDRAFT_133024 [Dichomitus squalens LYAD-421 SS1]|uniref:uncharacterized protein n=1 Tax=Dichomitus squalens (strain LYAD-421) TaxID=732165 RepID=UPI0004412B95|nr:uncharacterized protein DICSQDRAFT_133024 [Dichomitus squalens LYAD-421 SS1]EJF65406.1 hypothetical protein DICSQDRAFT_133024 [Dichomitus squalens LYAD-421 SS1]